MSRLILRRSALTGILLLLAVLTQASHFRYGDIAWRVVQANSTGRTIEFKVNAGWRLNVFDPISLSFGDGTAAMVPITYASINGQYSYGTGTVQHTYAANGDYTASYGSCCKISNLANNPGGSWLLRSVVNVGSGNNSPVTTVPAIVNLQTGLAAAHYLIPAADPDGQRLTFSLAGSAQGWPGVQPTGLSINSATGEITFNTLGKPVGQLWNAAVAISDGQTTVVVDFLIQITLQSNPPQFDYSVTPANQQVIEIAPQSPVSFTIRATDIDVGALVRLSGVGVPSGAVISPAFGVAANPVQHTFSWTPSSTQLGTFVLSFVAEDNNLVQTATSVTIIVSLRPRFDVPPTPAAGYETVYAPGQLISYSVQASDPQSADRVRIVQAQGRTPQGTLSPLYAGAALGPLPTVAANPTTGTFTWTPAASDWGVHNVVFTAEDSYGERATHEVEQLINTIPVFASAPVTTAQVGSSYSYAISVTDPDLMYGDAVDFVTAQALPEWLTLTTNPAAGTAVLSGIPPVSAAGSMDITLMAEDIHHHAYPLGQGVAQQSFTLTIANCSVQAAAHGLTVALDASGTARVTAAQVDNQSTASCGVASVRVSPESFTCANLGPNTVTLTVTDINGNTGTATAIVLVEDQLLPTITCGGDVHQVAPLGDCTPIVTWAAPVAADNCAVSVSSSHAPGTRFPVGATTVTYTATDAAGNTATCSFVVTVAPTPLVATISSPVLAGGVNIGCRGENTGTASLLVQGGCQPYQYAWSNGQTTATATNLAAGTYRVQVTDANGIQLFQSVNLTEPTLLMVSVAITSAPVFGPGAAAATIYLGYGRQNVTFAAAARGGVPGYTYQWTPAAGLSNPNSASVVASPTQTTTYTVTVADANGCTTRRELTVYVVDARCGPKDNKVIVCHRTGNGSAHDICISANAVPAHLAHGCTVGSCAVPVTGTARSTAAPVAGGVLDTPVLTAFPNPTDGHFTLQLHASTSGPLRVALFDLAGRSCASLFAGELAEGETRELVVDQTGLPRGIYYIRVVGGAQTEYVRLIVQP